MHKVQRIGLFGLMDLRSHGGLEEYTRLLFTELRKMGYHVSYNGRECINEGNENIREVWTQRVSRLLPLMTRPILRNFAVTAAKLYDRSWFQSNVRNVELVHYIGTGWNLMGFPLARASRKLKRIMTCLPAVHPGTWGDNKLDLRLYSQMDAVLTLSEYERQHLCKLGLDGKRVIRSVCTSDVCAPMRMDEWQFRNSGDFNDVLFIGRKSTSKGYHELRKAVKILHDQGAKVRLVSIGAAVENSYLPLPPELDIDLKVAGETQKIRALKECYMFALPSADESFGIGYVEAWNFAKPVICGVAPASRELVTRHSGGICTDGTASAIANAVTSLILDQEKADAMGLAGRNAVLEHYTPRKMAEKHVQHWADLGQ